MTDPYKASQTKQLKAIRLAITALTNERRRYSAGHYAYIHGVRADTIKDKRIKGKGFTWAEEDYKTYNNYTQAIKEMHDLIEILTDLGAETEPDYQQRILI